MRHGLPYHREGGEVHPANAHAALHQPPRPVPRVELFEAHLARCLKTTRMPIVLEDRYRPNRIIPCLGVVFLYLVFANNQRDTARGVKEARGVGTHCRAWR